jgi:hypothetical protein
MFEELRDSGSLDALLGRLLHFDVEAFLKLIVASSFLYRHIQKCAKNVARIAWDITSDDETINWPKELMQIANSQYRALTVEMQAYFLGDERKSAAELEENHAMLKSTRLLHDRRGTLEMKYVHPLPVRAKPLTALDLCFSGEHEEAATIYPAKNLSFFPTNAAPVMYFEVTISSLAKRNGGPSIGFSLEKPLAMPGTSWYSYGYSVDSDIVRNGIGIPPTVGINASKKPRVGQVWGVGYTVQFSSDEFLDDSKFIQPAGHPNGINFFVTLNGQLKYRIFIHSAPIMMQPSVMMANTGDGIIFNFTGDPAHPFAFDLKEIATWERPSGLEGARLNYEIMVRPNLNPAPPEHRLPPIANPQYVPIAKKALIYTNEELLTFGVERFATISGSYMDIMNLAPKLPPMPYSAGAHLIELDILFYYMDLTTHASADEARNIYVHLKPNMDETETAAVMRGERPQEELRNLVIGIALEHLLSICVGFENYVRLFPTLPKLTFPDGTPVTVADAQMPGSSAWVPHLWHPEFPFPLSQEAHRTLRVARILKDGAVLNTGFYENAVASVESLLGKTCLEALKLLADELAWAESQMLKLVLRLPTSSNPRFGFISSPTHATTASSSYWMYFDIISVLVQAGLVDLKKPNVFPSPEVIQAWLPRKDASWIKLFIWNAYTSIPLSSDTIADPSGLAIPSEMDDAFQTIMSLIAKERWKLSNKPLELPHVHQLKYHVADLTSLIRQLSNKNGRISTYNMTSFMSPAQLARLPPLPILTDPAVLNTSQKRAHGYRLINTQIQQLFYIFGRHTLLVPLLDWQADQYPALLAQAEKDLTDERNDAVSRLAPFISGSSNSPDPKPEILRPIRFAQSPRMRPAAMAILGLSLAGIVGAVAWLGFRLAPKRHKA